MKTGRTATFLLLALMGCTQSSEPPPQGELVQKVGSSVTPAGCLSGMVSALAMAVRDLHFRGNCIKDSESDEYKWTYIYKEKLESGSASTVEKCADGLATHLNDHIPYLEISLIERCGKRVKMFNGEKLIWAFDYKGR